MRSSIVEKSALLDCIRPSPRTRRSSSHNPHTDNPGNQHLRKTSGLDAINQFTTKVVSVKRSALGLNRRPVIGRAGIEPLTDYGGGTVRASEPDQSSVIDGNKH
jgi:hypothetical protein